MIKIFPLVSEAKAEGLFMPLATISAKAVCTVQEVCLAGFRLLLVPPYRVERTNYVRKKVLGVNQSCSALSLAAAGGILQKLIPVCGLWLQCRARLMDSELFWEEQIFWWLMAACPMNNLLWQFFHSCPILSPFSGRNTIEEGWQGPSRATVFSSYLRIRVESTAQSVACTNRHRNDFPFSTGVCTFNCVLLSYSCFWLYFQYLHDGLIKSTTLHTCSLTPPPKIFLKICIFMPHSRLKKTPTTQ